MLRFDAAAQAVQFAPFVEGGWQSALSLTGEACGGWATQLLGVSPDKQILFDWHSGLADDAIEDFERRMGSAPDANPRARVLSAPLMKILTDEELISDDARRRNSFYRELYEPAGAPYAGVGRLTAVPEVDTVLSVLRDRRAGPMSEDDRGVMAALLPEWAAALRLKVALEDEADRATAGAFDSLSMPAFVLDADGRLRTASATGAALLSGGEVFRTRRGQFEAVHGRNRVELRASMDAILNPDAVPGRSLVLSTDDGPLVVEVSRLPRAQGATLRSGAVLVLVTPARRAGNSAVALLKRTFQLSQAEAEVSVILQSGESLVAIAEVRGVRMHTLRNQLKSIFHKVGVGSQAQLIARVSALIGPVAI